MATHRRYRQIRSPSKSTLDNCRRIREAARHAAIAARGWHPIEAHVRAYVDHYVRRFGHDAANQIRIDVKRKLLRAAMNQIIGGMRIPCVIFLGEVHIPERLDIFAANRLTHHAWAKGMITCGDPALRPFERPVWCSLDGTRNEQKHFGFNFPRGHLSEEDWRWVPRAMAMQEFQAFLGKQLDPRGSASIALFKPFERKDPILRSIMQYTGTIVQQPPPPPRRPVESWATMNVWAGSGVY